MISLKLPQSLLCPLALISSRLVDLMTAHTDFAVLATITDSHFVVRHLGLRHLHRTTRLQGRSAGGGGGLLEVVTVQERALARAARENFEQVSHFESSLEINFRRF